ncbi:hypothetical protein IQ235_10715 [Oscillatoriales cyanobacterium LEGE 11467]|uniref:Uncharacterized protein n=1 Tax=Zarconia navalis LEGE 11467 TaxID=1828826 RepID=A0A928VZM2_9CYAN|nr:hypothetical protein [Zarconia navalis]MBE9041251.1 hypothetical protein [Zarconia navalis LEGE 11467]
MLEILVWSLLVGSLGIEGAIAGGWLYWQQKATKQSHEEEEEFLTHYNTEKEIWQEDLPQSQLPHSDIAQSNGDLQSSPHPQPEGLVDPRLVGWEYKIVRTSRELFRDPTILQKLRDEEAEAGWILLEKLDDCRVRFKRPIAMAQILESEYLKIDPYRSYYGSKSNPLSWLGAIVAIAALALPAYLGYTLVSTTLDRSRPESAPAMQSESSPALPTSSP